MDVDKKQNINLRMVSGVVVKVIILAQKLERTILKNILGKTKKKLTKKYMEKKRRLNL